MPLVEGIFHPFAEGDGAACCGPSDINLVLYIVINSLVLIYFKVLHEFAICARGQNPHGVDHNTTSSTCVQREGSECLKAAHRGPIWRTSQCSGSSRPSPPSFSAIRYHVPPGPFVAAPLPVLPEFC